jgi:hypothetical protein
VYDQRLFLAFIYNVVLMYLACHGVENAMFYLLLMSVFYCAGGASSYPHPVIMLGIDTFTQPGIGDEIKLSCRQSSPPDRDGVRRSSRVAPRLWPRGGKRDRTMSAHQD